VQSAKQPYSSSDLAAAHGWTPVAFCAACQAVRTDSNSAAAARKHASKQASKHASTHARKHTCRAQSDVQPFKHLTEHSTDTSRAALLPEQPPRSSRLPSEHLHVPL
jgi:hypothetical protein